VEATTGPTGGTPRGPPSDVFFNFGGSHYRTYRQHPQRAHHRHLQLWWWLLPDLLAVLPQGPAIDIFFNFGCRLYLTHWQHPQGAAIDVFFNFGGGRG
jgi:hypothetical protein